MADLKLINNVGANTLDTYTVRTLADKLVTKMDETIQYVNTNAKPGPQGPVGPTGATGPAGPQGIQGVQGLRGEPGPQGAQGAKGDTGPAGPMGPQGPQGQTGPQGPKGDKGTDGQSFTVVGTVNAASDLPTTAEPGTAYFVGAAAPRDVYVFATGSGWVNQGPLQGPEGPQGPAGPQGIQGIQGVQGPAGEAGAQGPKGDTGAPGPTGPQGPTGPKGSVGPSPSLVTVTQEEWPLYPTTLEPYLPGANEFIGKNLYFNIYIEPGSGSVYKLPVTINMCEQFEIETTINLAWTDPMLGANAYIATIPLSATTVDSGEIKFHQNSIYVKLFNLESNPTVNSSVELPYKNGAGINPSNGYTIVGAWYY